MYFVVVAARSLSASLPGSVSLSLFSDRAEGELARLDAQAGEVMRQDDLLRERDAALDRQTGHIRHLEEIAAHRERLVIERDTQLVELNESFDGLTSALASARQAVAAQGAECERLERAIVAQERIIAYRQSARWWFSLPWLRVRLWWQRVRGA
jgi:hypothetical protein